MIVLADFNLGDHRNRQTLTKAPCAASTEQQALFVCGCNRKPRGNLTFPAINKMKKNHGVLALIGWGILLPSGSIIASRDPLWYYLHTFIHFVGFLIGCVTVVAGKLLYDKMHAKVSTHRGIGIFVLALSILQDNIKYFRDKLISDLIVQFDSGVTESIGSLIDREK